MALTKDQRETVKILTQIRQNMKKQKKFCMVNCCNDDNGHKSPKIDKRQKQEIEDKKNAEISYI